MGSVSTTILFLENLLLKALGHLLFSNRHFRAARCVCVFRPGGIGDTICAVPALKAIRENFPDAKLILLTRKVDGSSVGAEDILGEEPWIDEIWNSDTEPNSRAGLRTRLRNAGIDTWVELPVDQAGFGMELRHMLFVRLAGIHTAVGFRADITCFMRRSLAGDQKEEHETDKLLNILRDYSFRIPGVDFSISVSRDDTGVVKEILEKKFARGSSIIAVNPGAKRPANRWPAERFREVALELIRHLGCRIAVLGGPDDRKAGALIAGADPERIVNLAGQLTVKQTLEFCRKCRMLVTNDTGIAHLAAAAGTRVVGIYNAWQRKGRWYPYGKGHSVLRADIPCEYCFKYECDDPRCISSISVQDVRERILHCIEI